MNIIITGSSGFIGTNLTKNLLNYNYNLLTISRKKNIQTLNNHLFVDLNNFSKKNKKIIDFNPDIVIHLAWQDLPDYSFKVQLFNLKISLSLQIWGIDT